MTLNDNDNNDYTSKPQQSKVWRQMLQFKEIENCSFN